MSRVRKGKGAGDNYEDPVLIESTQSERSSRSPSLGVLHGLTELAKKKKARDTVLPFRRDLPPVAGPSRSRSKPQFEETLVNGIDYTKKERRRHRNRSPGASQTTLTQVFKQEPEPKVRPSSSSRPVARTSSGASESRLASRKRDVSRTMSTASNLTRKTSSSTSVATTATARLSSKGSFENPISLLSSDDEPSLARRASQSSSSSRRRRPTQTDPRAPGFPTRQLERTHSQSSIVSSRSQHRVPSRNPSPAKKVEAMLKNTPEPKRSRSQFRYASIEDDIDLQLGSQEAWESARVLVPETLGPTPKRAPPTRQGQSSNHVLVAETMSPAKAKSSKPSQQSLDYATMNFSATDTEDEDSFGGNLIERLQARRKKDLAKASGDRQERRLIDTVQEESQVPDSVVGSPSPEPAADDIARDTPEPDGLATPRPLLPNSLPLDTPPRQKPNPNVVGPTTPKGFAMLGLVRSPTPAGSPKSPFKQLKLSPVNSAHRLPPMGATAKRRRLEFVADDDESYRPSPTTKLGRSLAVKAAPKSTAKPVTVPEVVEPEPARRPRRVQSAPGKYTLPPVDTPIHQWPTTKGTVDSPSGRRKRKSNVSDGGPGPSKLRESTTTAKRAKVVEPPKPPPVSARAARHSRRAVNQEPQVPPTPDRTSDDEDAPRTPPRPSRSMSSELTPLPPTQMPRRLSPTPLSSEPEEQEEQEEAEETDIPQPEVEEPEPEPLEPDLLDEYADFLNSPAASQSVGLRPSQQTPSKRSRYSASPAVGRASLSPTVSRTLLGPRGSQSGLRSQPPSQSQSKTPTGSQAKLAPVTERQEQQNLAARILADRAEEDRLAKAKEEEEELIRKARDERLRDLNQRCGLPEDDSDDDDDDDDGFKLNLSQALRDARAADGDSSVRKSRRLREAASNLASDAESQPRATPAPKKDYGFSRLMRKHDSEVARGVSCRDLERIMSESRVPSPEKGMSADNSWEHEEGLDSDQDGDGDGDVDELLAHKGVDDEVKQQVMGMRAEREAAEEHKRDLTTRVLTFWTNENPELDAMDTAAFPQVEDPIAQDFAGTTDTDELCALFSCGIMDNIEDEDTPLMASWLFDLAFSADENLALIASTQLLDLLSHEGGTHPFNDSRQLCDLVVGVWAKLGAKPEVVGEENDHPEVRVARDRQSASVLICQIVWAAVSSSLLLAPECETLLCHLSLLAVDPSTTPALSRSIVEAVDALVTAAVEVVDVINVAVEMADKLSHLPLNLLAKAILALGQGTSSTRELVRWLAMALLVPGSLDSIGDDDHVPSIAHLTIGLDRVIRDLSTPDPNNDYIDLSYMLTLWVAAASHIPTLLGDADSSSGKQLRTLASNLMHARNKIKDTSAGAQAGSLKSRLHIASNVLHLQQRLAESKAKAARLSGRGLEQGQGGQTRLSLGGAKE